MQQVPGRASGDHAPIQKTFATPTATPIDTVVRRMNSADSDVRSVNRHHTHEIHDANCLSQLVDSLSNVGFVNRVLRSHRYL
jgi:hypothetical protein